MSYRNFCFTYNNPSIAADDFENYLISLDEQVKYVVFQEEIGESGTPHFQGYIELKISRRFVYVQKLLKGDTDDSPWVTSRRGTRWEAIRYCKDPSKRIPNGHVCEYPEEVTEANSRQNGQGKRSDLTDAAELALTTRSLKRVAQEHPNTFIRYAKGFSALLSATAPKRDVVPKVILLFGATGLGKTRWVHQTYPDAYFKAPDTRWFDGYAGEATLCLDDYVGAPNKMSLSYLLQLIDRYPFMLEIKGGYTPLLASNLCITSNIHPRDWFNYEKRESQFKALARRFTHVYFFPNVDSTFYPNKNEHGFIDVSIPTFFEEWGEYIPESDYIVNATVEINDEDMEAISLLDQLMVISDDEGEKSDG